MNTLDHALEDERWTHDWAGGGEYRQLDYILLPRDLDEAQGNPIPQLVRKGMPWRGTLYEGERYDEVGEDSPKTSDHCPSTWTSTRAPCSTERPRRNRRE